MSLAPVEKRLVVDEREGWDAVVQEVCDDPFEEAEVRCATQSVTFWGKCAGTRPYLLDALLGRAEAPLRTENLLQVLASVTALCCVDKKGILSWPNPTAEKVPFPVMFLAFCRGTDAEFARCVQVFFLRNRTRTAVRPAFGDDSDLSPASSSPDASQVVAPAAAAAAPSSQPPAGRPHKTSSSSAAKRSTGRRRKSSKPGDESGRCRPSFPKASADSEGDVDRVRGPRRQRGHGRGARPQPGLHGRLSPPVRRRQLAAVHRLAQGTISHKEKPLHGRLSPLGCTIWQIVRHHKLKLH